MEYISLKIKENKYGIKERNWRTKLLKLKNNEISKILSIPEMAINTNKILLQMQIFSLLQILLIMK